jgi:hypothetical protein
VVIVIVTGNFGNRDNFFGHLPRSGVVDEDRWRRTGGTNDGSPTTVTEVTNVASVTQKVCGPYPVHLSDQPG